MDFKSLIASMVFVLIVFFGIMWFVRGVIEDAMDLEMIYRRIRSDEPDPPREDGGASESTQGGQNPQAADQGNQGIQEGTQGSQGEGATTQGDSNAQEKADYKGYPIVRNILSLTCVISLIVIVFFLFVGLIVKCVF